MDNSAWQEIRKRYERGGISYRELSKQFGVPVSAIGKRAKREDWSGDRKQMARKKSGGNLHEAAGRLLTIASDLVSKAEHERQMDVKTLKELTAVLKELNQLSRTIENEKEEDSIVRVILEGQAEEWGQ
ncbi:MAG: hypothetical protein Q3985_02250 [Eubacteriales bacterium]|nr:hypothetical protein [Eubacteriales bacterium]